MTDFIGYLATVVGISIMLPQLYRTYTTKRAYDLSWGMLILFFFNGALWLLYGAMVGSMPLIVANVIGLVENILLDALKYRYRNNSK